MSEEEDAFLRFDTSNLDPTFRRLAVEDDTPPSGVDMGELFHLIGALYGTIAAPEGWATAIDRICALAGASHAMSGVFDVHRPEVHRHSASSSLTNSELLNILNLATKERFERFEELYRLPPRTLMHFPEPGGAQSGREDGFIRVLREKFGVRRLISANANPHHSWFDYITLFFPVEARNAAGEAAIRFILPHMAQANAARRPLEVLKQRYNAVFAALDRLAFGVILVNGDRDIIAANQEANAMMEAADGLRRTADGRLSATTPQAEAELAAHIDSASKTATSRGATLDRHFTVSRRSGGADYILETTPFVDGPAGELNVRLEGAIIFCIDPENGSAIDPSGISRAFRFTPTETAISGHLLNGLSNDGIAEAQNVSVATVKTHAKALFSKTRTRNRADFIRLAASVTPPLRADG